MNIQITNSDLYLVAASYQNPADKIILESTSEAPFEYDGCLWLPITFMDSGTNYQPNKAYCRKVVRLADYSGEKAPWRATTHPTNGYDYRIVRAEGLGDIVLLPDMLTIVRPAEKSVVNKKPFWLKTPGEGVPNPALSLEDFEVVEPEPAARALIAATSSVGRRLTGSASSGDLPRALQHIKARNLGRELIRLADTPLLRAAIFGWYIGELGGPLAGAAHWLKQNEKVTFCPELGDAAREAVNVKPDAEALLRQALADGKTVNPIILREFPGLADMAVKLAAPTEPSHYRIVTQDQHLVVEGIWHDRRDGYQVIATLDRDVEALIRYFEDRGIDPYDTRKVEGMPYFKKILTPWQMTRAAFRAALAALVPTRPQEIILHAEHTSSLPSNEIHFKPVRSKSGADVVAAYLVKHQNGPETFASSSDITHVAGHTFFQNETDRIGRARVIYWIEGWLSDREAASETDFGRCFDRRHQQTVHQALLIGQPVPDEVKAEYPELVAKYDRESWQMTREEFKAINAERFDFKRRVIGSSAPFEAARFWRVSEDEVIMIGQHEADVREALAAGLPVPSKVLKDYPHLAPPAPAVEPWALTLDQILPGLFEVQVPAEPLDLLTLKALQSLERSLASELKMLPWRFGVNTGVGEACFYTGMTERVEYRAEGRTKAQALENVRYYLFERENVLAWWESDAGHRRIVKEALALGKAVPQAVLAAYPAAEHVSGETAPDQPCRAAYEVPLREFRQQAVVEIRPMNGDQVYHTVIFEGRELHSYPVVKEFQVKPEVILSRCHRQAVAHALSEGIQLAEDVARDYPDEIAAAAGSCRETRPEIWEMTQAEFLASPEFQVESSETPDNKWRFRVTRAGELVIDFSYSTERPTVEEIMRRLHTKSVLEAFKPFVKGGEADWDRRKARFVPARVLADYPQFVNCWREPWELTSSELSALAHVRPALHRENPFFHVSLEVHWAHQGFMRILTAVMNDLVKNREEMTHDQAEQVLREAHRRAVVEAIENRLPVPQAVLAEFGLTPAEKTVEAWELRFNDILRMVEFDITKREIIFPEHYRPHDLWAYYRRYSEGGFKLYPHDRPRMVSSLAEHVDALWVAHLAVVGKAKADRKPVAYNITQECEAGILSRLRQTPVGQPSIGELVKIGQRLQLGLDQTGEVTALKSTESQPFPGLKIVTWTIEYLPTQEREKPKCWRRTASLAEVVALDGKIVSVHPEHPGEVTLIGPEEPELEEAPVLGQLTLF